jgi:hypothetical protein
MLSPGLRPAGDVVMLDIRAAMPNATRGKRLGFAAQSGRFLARSPIRAALMFVGVGFGGHACQMQRSIGTHPLFS